MSFLPLEKALSSLSFLFSFLSSCPSLPTSGVRRGFFMPLVVGQIILSPENIGLST